MRNATTVRIFAVLIGFALVLPAAAEEQNSSTLKPGPVATDNATSSCSSASILVESTSPGFGGLSVGLSTPLDADPLAIFPGAAEASGGRICVIGEGFCVGKKSGSSCGKGHCKAYAQVAGGWACYCDLTGEHHEPCHNRRVC